MANITSENGSKESSQPASELDGSKDGTNNGSTGSNPGDKAPKLSKNKQTEVAQGKFKSSAQKLGEGKKGVYAGDLKRGKGMFVFTLLFLSVIGYGLYLIWTPQDTSDLVPAKSASGDLLAEIKATYESGGVLKLDEAGLNRWLQDRVEAKQEGMFGDFVAIKELKARLHEGYMELIIVRDIAGYLPQTVSLYMSFNKTRDHRGVTQNELHFSGPELLGFTRAGGRMGSLNVPQGYLMLSIDAFNHLGSAFEKEISYIMSRMQHIKVTKGYIELSRSNISAPSAR